ncbi:MAG: hypothetical protein AAB502_08890, partial [Chloroflexota bacterium]
ARATVSVIVPTPPPLRFTLALFPSEVVLLPGAKHAFRASLLGLNDTRVEWSFDGKSGFPEPADVFNITETDIGDYTVRATSMADPTKWVEAKVKVVPGVWVLTGKTETTSPSPTGSVSLSSGSATATSQVRTQISKWRFTWTEPPTSLPAGQTFKGTFSAQDAGSVYNQKEEQFPTGGVIFRVMSGVDIVKDGFVSVSAGYTRGDDKGPPFMPSASKSYELPVPKGRVGGLPLSISVSVAASAGFERTGVMESRGEVLYKYELRMQ